MLGVGDDCALVDVANGMDLAVSVDTMVSGTHFFPDVDPENLGHKALAVNLSDMAAMGAMPYWAMLALTLPAVDHPWLAAFAKDLKLGVPSGYIVDPVCTEPPCGENERALSTRLEITCPRREAWPRTAKVSCAAPSNVSVTFTSFSRARRNTRYCA